MSVPFFRLCGCVLLMFACVAWPLSASGAVCFVTTTGVPSNDGASWSTSLNLVTALARPACEEIRVAKGVYKPPVSSEFGFPLLPGVELYGGYTGVPGSENDPQIRDPRLHLTVLSGDTSNDDVIDANGITLDFENIVGVNSRIFVLAPDKLWMPDTIIDGFVITAGRSAISVESGSDAQELSPTLRNMDFVGNRQAISAAAANGALIAMHVSQSTFRNNGLSATTAGGGGALTFTANTGGTIRPVFNNVTFASNRARLGGVILASSVEAVVDVEFSHVTMSGNSAALQGGAIYLGGPSVSVIRFTNSIVWGNSAPTGPQFYMPTNENHISMHTSIIQGGCSGSVRCANASVIDPQLGPLQDNGGYTLTMMPHASGAAINTGQIAYCPPKDQRGVARPHGAGCDIGAVENTDPVFRSGFEP